MEENVHLSSLEDKFMKTFKYYKSRSPKPSLKDVISVEKWHTDKVTNITIDTAIEDTRTGLLGLTSLKEWKIFIFKTHPGLLFIRNPFTALGQRYWVRRCLEAYPRKPNQLNIDIEINLQDWWEECFRNGQCEKLLQKKLRWTTLGYHHNWDTKVYTEQNRSPFPEDLAELSDVLAQYLGYSNFRAEAAIVNYYHMNSTLSAHTDHSEVNLEAPLFSFSCMVLGGVIVDKSLSSQIMSPHPSRSAQLLQERTQYSFGQSAIFLLGGKDKSTEPSAILINSGDIVVMSKEARLCYHAVPKILPASESPWDEKDITHASSKNSSFKYLTQSEDMISLMKENEDNKKWQRFSNYIQESRININVRQVLNEKQNSMSL